MMQPYQVSLAVSFYFIKHDNAKWAVPSLFRLLITNLLYIGPFISWFVQQQPIHHAKSEIHRYELAAGELAGFNGPALEFVAGES